MYGLIKCALAGGALSVPRTGGCAGCVCSPPRDQVLLASPAHTGLPFTAFVRGHCKAPFCQPQASSGLLICQVQGERLSWYRFIPDAFAWQLAGRPWPPITVAAQSWLGIHWPGSLRPALTALVLAALLQPAAGCLLLVDLCFTLCLPPMPWDVQCHRLPRFEPAALAMSRAQEAARAMRQLQGLLVPFHWHARLKMPARSQLSGCFS